jgi:YidC/Oxa1 family membrane protein insertase
MDFQKKIFAYVLLLTSAFLLWSTWQQEHAPTPAAQVVAQEIPSNPSDIVQGMPAQAVAVTAPTTVAPVAVPQQPAQLISVKTDVLDLSINPIDGNLVKSSLLNYPLTIHSKDPFVLFNDQAGSVYEAQTGLITDAGQKLTPTFQAAQAQYEMSKDQNSLDVVLSWSDAGLDVTKTYTFHRGQYSVDVAYAITNRGAQAWQGYYFSQLVRNGTPPAFAEISRYTYFGAAISSSEEHYEKIKFSNMEDDPLNRSVTGGWVAMIQHYFVSAWVPNKEQAFHFYSKANVQNDLYTIGGLSPKVSIAPGETFKTTMTLYSGPATAENLDKVAPYLNLTVDYGWLWFISNILFWMMTKIYSFVGNWGWSIVLVTLVIKIVFYQLSAKSYKSMAAMKRLQPKILLLKDRFANDKQQMSRATMELYKKEGVNPLGGCLPMLVQIPVFIALYFIALYWVIVESVELRQSPFIFWIHDLSIKDPFYILPVIMGLTMFIQQKISPPPPDPVLAKVMMLLPDIFTVLFLHFHDGLLL